jgi:ribosomal protein L4
MDKPSVKKFNEMLSDLDLTSEKLTIILPSDVEGFRMMLKSCSNLENIRIKRAIDVNIFDIMDCTKLLTSHPAVQELEERLA